MDMHTLLYLKWIITRAYCTAQGTLLGYVAAWVGGEFGGEWMCKYVMAESLLLST